MSNEEMRAIENSPLYAGTVDDQYTSEAEIDQLLKSIDEGK